MTDPVFGLPSRRSFLKLGGLAVGGLALAACGGAPRASTSASGGTATERKGIGNVISGLGVPRDYAKAADWYGLAAAQGMGGIRVSMVNPFASAAR